MKQILFFHPAIQSEFKANSLLIKKISPTLARCIKPEEIGTVLDTYVLNKKNRITLEMSEILEPGYFILRNPKPLGTDEEGRTIYNERYSDEEGMIYNFGKLITTTEFEPLIKLPLITAIQISQQLRQALDLGRSRKAQIVEAPNKSNMIFEKGDFITDRGSVLNKTAFDEHYAFATQ
ncbi:MAG: hypothetical protein WC004_04035 [Candidatus Absconditabacterales bacterium]